VAGVPRVVACTPPIKGEIPAATVAAIAGERRGLWSVRSRASATAGGRASRPSRGNGMDWYSTGRRPIQSPAQPTARNPSPIRPSKAPLVVRRHVAQFSISFGCS
jgi:hypothetical protein